MAETEQVERIYIREAAQLLNRRMATLRKWEQINALPPHLQPHRGNRGWRYWTPEQIEGIREWLRDTDRRPGKGLPHYNPTELQLERAISAMRRPREANKGSATSAVPDKVVSKKQLKAEAEAAKKPAPRRAKRPGT
jgi:DNA-binding transcriptional MerR regulator